MVVQPGRPPAGDTSTPKATEPAKDADVDMLWGQRVPMRDGITLSATVFKPRNQAEPLPAIFTLTPYISDTYLERAIYFAKNSYVFALVDVRGRGNSEGEFEPFYDDGKDGHDVVEWLAGQAWCSGQVAMWGGSHAGFNQWATLKESPAHLKTIVPAAAAHPGVDFPFYKNVFTPYSIQWLTFTSGVTGNSNIFDNTDFWTSKYAEFSKMHAPFKDFGKVAGNDNPIFQKWLAHPIPDEYWASMTPKEDDYRRINVPILTITGHYDADQPGAMTYYHNHMKYGTKEAKENHFLIMGPWDHPGTRTPKKEFGGLTLAEASVLDLNALHKQWYDWTMKKGKRPEFLKNRVAYYVPGAEVWKYADSLESIQTGTMKLNLESHDGQATDVFHSGTLAENETATPPDGFTYDPMDTRTAPFFKKEFFTTFITNQTYSLNTFGNGVFYHSEPFAAPIELTGYAKLSICIELDVPDTDFYAEVGEVKSDGSYVLLTSDLMRARYRDSLTKAELLEPGAVNRFVFDGFTFFSRQIAKNSRVRLTFNCINHPFFEKNYNAGGVVSDESGEDSRVAHVKVYHDKSNPSFLELPTVAG